MRTEAAEGRSQRIGRFELVRELGRGAQGTVFLARDTHLGREVALKTVNVEGYDPGERTELTRMLLDEARIVSKLQHPNLVTLYDAGEHAGAPYLVFEYVEGTTLAQALREKGSLPPPQAVAIAIGVLRGLACAHGMHVLHRDIKPGNIMLTSDNTPRVMDFGIACHATGGKAPEGLAGTPSYMAPEYVQGGAFQPASDVFALGAVLYEMLTGRPPVKGSTAQATLQLIVKQDFERPSRANPKVDEQLDALVMKALAKRPEDRYPDPGRMAEALERYLAPPPEGDPEGAAGGTLEFLLRRMRHKSDFPALSDTVSAINRVTASDREPVSVLCNAILKDVALTSKLLKLVNAAHFKQHGGGIRTVSRAIGILGFDSVRNITTSLLLFDHLQNSTQAATLKEEVAAAYFSGVVARELAAKLGLKNAEEAFICAMFRRLGRLLVSFYLHEEKEAIVRLAQARGWDESRAAHEVLGLGYEDVGMGVARHWNFPEAIIASMRPLGEEAVGRAAFEADKLRVIAAAANDLCDTVRAGTPKERAARLDAVTRKFGAGAGVTQMNAREAIKSSFEALSSESAVLGAGAAIAPVLERAKDWNAAGSTAPQGQPAPANDEATQTVINAAQFPDADVTQHLQPGGFAAAANRSAVLSAGVQDITNVLAGDFQLNDVLRIILETMYRAIGFKRVLLCVRDPQRNALRARLGFGDGADAIIQAGFALPLAGPPDIFSAATGQGADLCIEDLDASNIREHVPQWFRKAVPARALVLFPLMVKGRAVGLIYGDTDRTGSFNFKPEELNMLRTLRNQAVLALKQGG
ncbi:MAG TPA: protein kinase [Burkholderiales bacterium]|nr:protein kinase [Burkholderiales bacterium]